MCTSRDLDLDVDFAAGEEMRTEISAKFRRAGVEDELAAAGLRLTHWWTDPASDFALSLTLTGCRLRSSMTTCSSVLRVSGKV